MSTAKGKQKSTENTDEYTGFTAEEKAAMQARAKELKAEARRKKGKAEGERDLLEKIAEMTEPERSMALRLHEIIKAHAPELAPRTWYGMPAYNKDGKVLCHYQSASKFKTRYGTFGFSEEANLDDGDMWPTAFALKELTDDVEARIIALLKQAVS